MPGKPPPPPPSVAPHSLPAAHLLQLAELVGRWQVKPDDLLAGSGLSLEALADPGARVPLGVAAQVIERARAMTGEPGIGFHLGLQMRISAHGYLGFAALTAATLGEAIALAERFAPTRTTAIACRLHRAGDTAALVIEEQAALGSAQDVVIFALLVGLWQIGNTLTGHALRGSVEVAFAEPDYFWRFAQLAPGPVRFGCPAHQILIDAALLDLPLIMADPVALRLARQQCEQELNTLGSQGQLVARTRTLLGGEGDAAPAVRSLSELAIRLRVSERTLKRQLAAKGVTFSQLLDTQRREQALLLLRLPDLSLAELADRLGYSDAANFTRAFRRWTGMSPRQFRQRSEGGKFRV